MGWAYHETLHLLKRLLHGRVEYEAVALDGIDKLETSPDAFFLEPFSNYLKAPGQALDARRFISKIANIGKPITIIVDKTTNPFCLDGIDEVLADESLLVSVESLSKYMQYGDAIALGGVISLIAKASSKAAERAEALQETILQYAHLQGQHMDPRLAWSLAPTRKLLSLRLARMQCNALLTRRRAPQVRDWRGFSRRH